MAENEIRLPYDPTILEGMQKNLDLRRKKEYLNRLSPEQKVARQIVVDAIARERAQLEDRPPATVPLLDLSAGPDKAIIRTGGNCITLSPNEEYVLTALVTRGAMSLSALRKDSGDEHADRTLKNLRDKHKTLKPYIKMPGGNNRGGYSTLILFADNASQ